MFYKRPFISTKANGKTPEGQNSSNLTLDI